MKEDINQDNLDQIYLRYLQTYYIGVKLTAKLQHSKAKLTQFRVAGLIDFKANSAFKFSLSRGLAWAELGKMIVYKYEPVCIFT